MMRVALLLALIVPTLASPLGPWPRRIVWRETITTNGATGTLVARTHLVAGRDIDSHYLGSLDVGRGMPRASRQHRLRLLATPSTIRSGSWN